MNTQQIKRFSIAALLFAFVSTTYAQTLEEVVVTAQRRAESMQDIPVTVTAISADDLSELGWDRPNEIAAQVPNMQVSTPYFSSVNRLFR